jgi:hypothetical protein
LIVDGKMGKIFNELSSLCIGGYCKLTSFLKDRLTHYIINCRDHKATMLMFIKM